MATKVFGITFGKDKPVTAALPNADTPAPVINFTPSLPSINALPNSIKESYKNKALIRKFVSVGIVLVVIFGALFGYSVYGDIQHKTELAAFDTESSTLNAQIQELQPFENYKVEVAGKLTTLAEYLSKDVDSAKIVKSLFDIAIANGIILQDVSISINGDDGTSSCVSVDPFATIETIGCVTIKGSQPSPTGLNGFFDQISANEGYVNVFVGNSSYDSASPENNSFEGSFAFTSALYSNKFSNFILPIEILLESGLDTPVNPVDPNATPTPSPTNPVDPNATPTPSPTETPNPNATPTPTPTGTSQGNG